MPRKREIIDVRLLSKVSQLYFYDSLTQSEIAERLHLSRPKVSRLLQQARDQGVIQITIQSPQGIFADIEAKLEHRFNLNEVIIADVNVGDSKDTIAREIGRVGAEYLQRTVADDEFIGISWGTTLNWMVQSMQPTSVKNVEVVQIIGGLGPPSADVHATDLCRRLAHHLNSRLSSLSAPGIVDNPEAKRAIVSDRHVRQTLELFSKLDVAFVGIGAPVASSVLLRDGSIISRKEAKELADLGAVGDIALRFFDVEGMPVQSDLDDRVIGITLEQLKKVKRVVGVAGGPGKRNVIRSAINGGLINVLITDRLTAESLL